MLFADLSREDSSLIAFIILLLFLAFLAWLAARD